MALKLRFLRALAMLRRLIHAIPDLREFVSGSFWVVLGAGLSQGSMLIASLLVANVLGIAGYGRYALVQSTMFMLAGLAQISFAVVVAQQDAILRHHDRAKIGEIASFCFLVSFALAVIFAAGLVLGSSLVGRVLFRDALLSPGLALSGLALPWLAVSAVQQGLFSGLEKFRIQTALSVALIPAVVALPVAGAWRYGFVGAVSGLVLAYFLRFAVAQVLLVRIFRSLGLRWVLGGIREKLSIIGRIALPATIGGLLLSLATWGGPTLLIRSAGGAETLGLFAAAFSIKTMILFVPSQTVIVLLPMLTRLRGEDRDGHHNKLLWMNTGANFSVSVILAVAAIMVAPWIMGLFGAQFRDGGPILTTLLLATPLEALTTSLYQDVQSQGRFWKAMLAINLPLATVVLSLAALLTPPFHAQGLALAWLGGWTAALAGTAFVMWSNRRTIAA